MAAKFTAGDSIKTTRFISAKNPPPNVRTSSHTLKSGTTMAGMPGYINAHQTEDMGHAKGGKGFGPHREEYIGKRGSSGAKGMGKGATGTTTKDYKSSSTDSAGSIHGNSNTGAHMVHTKNRTTSMPGQKAPPTSKGILGGTVRAAGIDRGSNKRSAGFKAATGHAGRMESLSGKARTSYEGRRKSSMY